MHVVPLDRGGLVFVDGAQATKMLPDFRAPSLPFMAGQVVMLDTTDRFKLKQVSVVSFGQNAGPHNLVLSSDDNRLVVTDYFLNEDAEGIIHFEGDHKVHVLKVTHDTLTEDKRFKLDFNTAFSTGPARPHGIAMK